MAMAFSKIGSDNRMNKDLIVTALTISLPSLMVLVGILVNRNDANRLDARITNEISRLESSIRSDMAAMRGEMSAMRNQFHSDVLMLVSSDKEQDRRITRLEERG